MLQNGKHLTRITNVSSLISGQMLALRIDGEVTRVIVEIRNSGIYVFLVDIGEELKYHVDYELFEMEDFYKSLPAQALLCKIKDPRGKKVPVKLLQKFLHKEVEMEVVRSKYNTIHVRTILSDMQNLLSDSSSDEEWTKKSHTSHVTTTYTSTNPFLDDLLCENMKETVKICENADGDASSDEIKLRNEMKEAMNEFKRFDRNVIARLQHQLEEKEPPVFEITKKLPIPTIAQKICVEMSFCEDIHIFFGYIIDANYYKSYEPSLKAFNNVINRPENVQKYEKLKRAPGIFCLF